MHVFRRYGFPVYDRDRLLSLLATILLVGAELEWWRHALLQFAGLPHLVPDHLLEDVLALLVQTHGYNCADFLGPDLAEAVNVSVPSDPVDCFFSSMAYNSEDTAFCQRSLCASSKSVEERYSGSMCVQHLIVSSPPNRSSA